MDSRFEKELFRLKGTGTELFVHPSYDGQGNIITVVVNTIGKHIESVNIQTGKRTPLTASTSYEIDNPVAMGNQMIYRGAFDANNSFYRQDQPNHFGHNALMPNSGYAIPNYPRAKIRFSFHSTPPTVTNRLK